MSTESVKARLAAATPRPWVLRDIGNPDGPQIGRPDDDFAASICDHGTPANGGGGFHRDEDAILAAHAPTDLELALEVIEAAKRACDTCESLERGEPWHVNLRAALDRWEAAP